jgi:hypothetical protein
MKKETLEEAFNKIVDSSDYVLFDYASFEEGAKWQQERSYSEEEVLKLLINFSDDRTFLKKDIAVKWFEKFKNK